VEFATLTWVEWFDNRRLLEPIGNIHHAEVGRGASPPRDNGREAADFRARMLRGDLADAEVVLSILARPRSARELPAIVPIA